MVPLEQSPLEIVQKVGFGDDPGCYFANFRPIILQTNGGKLLPYLAKLRFGISILWQHDILAIILWQKNAMAKWYFGKMISWDTRCPFSKKHIKTQCSKRTGLQIGSRSSRNLNSRRITNPKVFDLCRKNICRSMRSKRTRRNPNYVLLSLILID